MTVNLNFWSYAHFSSFTTSGEKCTVAEKSKYEPNPSVVSIVRRWAVMKTIALEALSYVRLNTLPQSPGTRLQPCILDL